MKRGWFAVDYRTVWRWHFYAGLVCIPFIVLLSLTGSVYLFKPQIESWLDRPYDGLALTGAPGSASAQAKAASAAVPGSVFEAYELPQRAGDATRVLLRDAAGEKVRVYVHPETLAVLAIRDESSRLMEIVKTIHGELLLGDGGSIVVELAASWAIVMIVTGLYLWWPRRAGPLAGILYPRLRAGGRVFWRDLHAVTGVWVSFFAVFLLLTALPWTNVWGAGFKQLRQLAETTPVRQDWTQSRSSEHAEHAGHTEHRNRGGDAGMPSQAMQVTLDEVVARVAPMALAPPVQISPPTAREPVWAVRSMTQNRPQRVSIDIDARTGAITHRETFADRPAIDRVIGVGIAAHEGQLFAPLNQLLGVLTAAALATLSISAAVMWWRRRPSGALGAPAPPGNARLGRGFVVLTVICGVLLPVLGASLVLLASLEWLLLRRVPRVGEWLGVSAARR